MQTDHSFQPTSPALDVKAQLMGALPKLRAFAVSLCGRSGGRAERADDLVQETIVRALSNMGSLTQRYVKRHGHDRKSAEIRRLCGFSFPHLTLRFQDDFWGWNADRIPKLFIGEVVLSEQVDVAP
jgi:hypothetical protein